MSIRGWPFGKNGRRRHERYPRRAYETILAGLPAMTNIAGSTVAIRIGPWRPATSRFGRRNACVAPGAVDPCQAAEGWNRPQATLAFGIRRRRGGPLRAPVPPTGRTIGAPPAQVRPKRQGTGSRGMRRSEPCPGSNPGRPSATPGLTAAKVTKAKPSGANVSPSRGRVFEGLNALLCRCNGALE